MNVTTYHDSNNNEYYVDNGVLYISAGASGTGVMQNFTSSSNLVETLSIAETFTTVVMDSTMTTVGNYAFNNMSALTDITMPSVTFICISAFQKCTNLALTSLPSGVTYIGNYTFSRCTNLSNVSLPSSLTSIDTCAFYGCTNLTSIKMSGTTPATVGSNLCPTATNIYVPYGTGNAYKSSWSAYANQIVELADPIRKMKLMCLDKGENVTSATGNSTQTGTPTPTNPIPVISTTYYDSDGNPVELRKVGTYEDTYANGVITRNVGVKALDGTENWTLNGGVSGLFHNGIDGSAKQSTAPYYGLCTHYLAEDSLTAGGISDKECTYHGTYGDYGRISIRNLDYDGNLAGFKSWLATQYANGTPIIVYYPLATPTTESKTLTTKYDVKTMKPMFVKSALPDGYTEVEYIQGSGTQLIDTGYNFVSDTDTFDIEYQYVTLENHKWAFGMYNAPKSIGVTCGANGAINLYYNNSSTYRAIYDTNKHHFVADSNGVTIDDVNAREFSSFETTSSAHIWLFGVYGGSSSNNSSSRIYRVKHTRNGADLYDYVPCVYHYGQADAVVGMYDLVSNTFKTNSGTGTFTAGNPVMTRFKTVKAKVMMEVIQ